MRHSISIKTVKNFLDQVNWTKIIKKASTASKGERLYPARNSKNDAKSNLRIDKGADVDGKSGLILQANKNAEDREVRKSAQQDSHAILAKGQADPQRDLDGVMAKEQLTADFKKQRSSSR